MEKINKLKCIVSMTVLIVLWDLILNSVYKCIMIDVSQLSIAFIALLITAVAHTSNVVELQNHCVISIIKANIISIFKFSIYLVLTIVTNFAFYSLLNIIGFSVDRQSANLIVTAVIAAMILGGQIYGKYTSKDEKNSYDYIKNKSLKLDMKILFTISILITLVCLCFGLGLGSIFAYSLILAVLIVVTFTISSIRGIHWYFFN